MTFKSKSSVGKAACWYLAAYVAFTLIAAALQGLYKAPVYQFFMETLGMGAAGETAAANVGRRRFYVYKILSFFGAGEVISHADFTKLT